MTRLQDRIAALRAPQSLTPLTCILGGAAAVSVGASVIFGITNDDMPRAATSIWAVTAGLAFGVSAAVDAFGGRARRLREARDEAFAESFDALVALVMMRGLMHVAEQAPSQGETTTDADGVAFMHHANGQCDGAHCPLHSPSEHHMKGWPVVFDRDRKPLISRRCPHGLDHPDPDSLAYILGLHADDPRLATLTPDEWTGLRATWERHHCDACCQASPIPRAEPPLPHADEVTLPVMPPVADFGPPTTLGPVPAADEMAALRQAVDHAAAVDAGEADHGLRRPPYVS